MMAERLSLRQYQQELAARLRGAESGHVASKLGMQVGAERWLVDLSDVDEVIPVPAVTSVPLTRAWFRGLANIRGKLYGVVDFSAFLGGPAAAISERARLLLISERYRIGSALLIDGSLGLRHLEQLQLRETGDTGAAWLRAEYTGGGGEAWKELDVPQLVQHPDFLGAAS
jgi:twitching motility protein PilI